MLRLIECLSAFNRKERYYVVRKLLGNASHPPAPSFRHELGSELDLTIPADPWWAMDYHLDWMYAALVLARDNAPERVYEHTGIIRAQQEDMDLLLAYDDGDTTHLIFVEAKGVTGYSNQQMTSKMDRLAQIFGQDGKAWPGVTPHLVLLSPKPPSNKLKMQAWPQWAAPRGEFAWIPLCIPENLKRVTRCDAQRHRDQTGNFWTIVS